MPVVAGEAEVGVAIIGCVLGGVGGGDPRITGTVVLSAKGAEVDCAKFMGDEGGTPLMTAGTGGKIRVSKGFCADITLVEVDPSTEQLIPLL
jgi:hypothetical protein